MTMLRWVGLALLTLTLFSGEAQPELLRYGLERDGCRVVVDLVLPVLPPDQRAQVQALMVGTIPGFTAGAEVSAWVVNEHTRLAAEMAQGKAADPQAAVFNGWFHESVIRTTWANGGLLSLHAEHQGYNGGAHGWLQHSIVLLDTMTLRPLTLEDLIAPADQPVFAELLTSTWCRANRLVPGARPSQHGLFVDDLPAKLPLITATGVEVIYPPYEVGPWATGTVRVTLTREQVQPFLKRDPWK